MASAKPTKPRHETSAVAIATISAASSSHFDIFPSFLSEETEGWCSGVKPCCGNGDDHDTGELKKGKSQNLVKVILILQTAWDI
jgi:hypothetical protein